MHKCLYHIRYIKTALFRHCASPELNWVEESLNVSSTVYISCFLLRSGYKSRNPIVQCQSDIFQNYIGKTNIRWWRLRGSLHVITASSDPQVIKNDSFRFMVSEVKVWHLVKVRPWILVISTNSSNPSENSTVEWPKNSVFCMGWKYHHENIIRLVKLTFLIVLFWPHEEFESSIFCHF